MAPKTNIEKDQRILDIVKAKPGIRVYELCEEMSTPKMPNNQIRPRLDRLLYAGLIHFKKEPGVCRIFPGPEKESTNE